jgi:preprotein translocase subunit YajC
LIMRPQRKRQQAIAKTLSELTPGTRVMLGSGLFGTVVGVGQKQVVLEISPGTELTVLKQAVSRVVTDDDEDVDVEVDDLADMEPDEVVESEPTATDSDTEPPTTGPGSRPTTAG